MKEQVIWTAAALVLCAALPAKAGAGPNRVTAIEVDGPRIVVHGTQKPDFSAFKLAQPARLVVDLAGADVTDAAAPAAVHNDGIAGVTVAQFDEGAVKVGRIVIALDSDARYDVQARGNDLIVAIGQASASAEPGADPNLVASREDVREVPHPATHLESVAVKGDGETRTVVLGTDGEVGRIGIVELKNPGRLALDLHAVVSSAAHKTVATGPLKGVRVAKHDDGVRVVLDAAGDAMPRYEVVRGEKALTVKVGEHKARKAATPADTKPAEVARPAPAQEDAAAPAKGELQPIRTAVAEHAPALVRVRAVDLRTDGGKTRVIVDCDGPVQFEVTRPDATTAVLALRGADLPERLERKPDASPLGA